MPTNQIFQRLELLTGSAGLDHLHSTKVAVFGLGGVGSWAAEGLVRSGIGRLALIDNDVVEASNINRQLQAHSQNIGQPKVSELAQRLALINPHCSLDPQQEYYQSDGGPDFKLGSYDYVLDCIDSVASKIDLMMHAHSSGTTLYSSMGAAFRMDPAQIKVGSIWQTGGCPLAKIIRKRLRHQGFSGDFQAVYSSEALAIEDRTAKGSAVQVTATFGMFLTGLVVQDVQARA